MLQQVNKDVGIFCKIIDSEEKWNVVYVKLTMPKILPKTNEISTFKNPQKYQFLVIWRFL